MSTKEKLLAKLEDYNVTSLRKALKFLELEEESNRRKFTSKPTLPKKRAVTKKEVVVLSGGNKKVGRFTPLYTRAELIKILEKQLPQYEYTSGSRSNANYIVFSDASTAPSPSKRSKSPSAKTMPISQFLRDHKLKIEL